MNRRDLFPKKLCWTVLTSASACQFSQQPSQTRGRRRGGWQHNSIDFPQHASAQLYGKGLWFVNVMSPAASLSILIRWEGNSR